MRGVGLKHAQNQQVILLFASPNAKLTQMTAKKSRVCSSWGRSRALAGELKRLVDTVRYDWVKEVVKSFDFDQFRKGLEWFSGAQCPTCPKAEEHHARTGNAHRRKTSKAVSAAKTI